MLSKHTHLIISNSSGWSLTNSYTAATATLRSIAYQNPDAVIEIEGDVNQDGTVDVADIAEVISIMAARARAAGANIEAMFV